MRDSKGRFLPKKPNCKCIKCGGGFKATPSRIMGGGGKYCSEKCRERKGKKNSNWRGGKTKDAQGYVLVKKPDHPFADCRGYILEHRLILEKKLGRYLEPRETTHHLNGIKDDNREKNLQLFITHSQHIKQCHLGKSRFI